ncbi:MAG: hypothetical protein GKS05_11395 [Nitrospirales bacterium]|nr:hypothetical protein [Nitrospirales bacterium]
MTITKEALARIIAPMQEPVRRYGEQIHALAGSNGLAITLYGAIASTTFDLAQHMARSVVVLQAIDLMMLRQLAKEGAKLGKVRIAAPLIMTPEYIAASVDSFPLEFIEIQQSRLCLSGPDHFEPLTFIEAHVRLQCERELKTILIGMRQGLLAAAGREKLFSEIESDVAERVIRTLRGLLWLHDQREGLPASQVIDAVSREVNRPLKGIQGSMDHRHTHGWDEFCALYEDVDALRKLVDAW